MSKLTQNLRKTPVTGKAYLRDYNSVAGLKADELKRLCKEHNIDVKFPKKARIVLLCHCLGLSTTGHVQSIKNYSSIHQTDIQKKELANMTPAYLCQLKDWKKEISSLPDIEESVVKKYLINTDVMTVSDARTYKISRPFALQQFVHSLMYSDNGQSEFSVVRAQCNPSQSANQDEIKVVFVIIDKYLGEPYGGFCTCTVGNSERCGHIGAVLFKLAELQATGVSEGPSSTDVLCKWADPKGSKAEPTVFQELKIRKVDGPIRRTVDDYGKKSTSWSPPTYDQVAELRACLIDATHNTGQYCPAVHVLNCERFNPPSSTRPAPNIIRELPGLLKYDSEAIAPAKEIDVKTTPVVINELVTKKFDNPRDAGFVQAADALYQKAENMAIDINEVNDITRGQSANSEWHEQRRGAITATKFDTVIKLMNKIKSSDSLLQTITGDTKQDKLKNVPSVKWGRKNEQKARHSYITKNVKHHKDFKVKEQGLMVYDECHFIRGSPDGIVSCTCHGRTLLEIKCPFSARMLTVAEGMSQGKIKYIQKINGRMFLKEDTSDGYYAQVQGLMGITKTQSCHFVVWTTRDMVTINVPFSEDYFRSKIVASCKQFFRNEIIPKLILNETPKNGEKSPSLETDIPNGPLFTATAIGDSDSVQDDQPSKRKGASSPKKAASKLITSPKLVIPKSTVNDKGTTSAQLILAESTAVYRCAQCSKVLPDDGIAADNSNASVGCDCPNCAGCDIWMCWPCARYDQDWEESGCNWYCPECTVNVISFIDKPNV